MKKKLTAFILAAALVMSLPAAASAAELTDNSLEPVTAAISDGGDSGISLMSTASSTISADRTSNTSGKVFAYALFSKTASKAVCTIYLQEKHNGSWRTATGVPTTAYSKTVRNVNSIAAGKVFTLKKGKTYRAKIVFADTYNGKTSTKTRYTGAF